MCGRRPATLVVELTATTLGQVSVAAHGRRVEPLLTTALELGARLSMPRAERIAGIVAIVRTDPNAAVRRHYTTRFEADAEVRATALAQANGANGGVLDPWMPVAERVAALARQLVAEAPGAVAPLLPRLPVDMIAPTAGALCRLLSAGTITPETALFYVAHLDHHPELDDTVRVALLAALGATRAGALTQWIAAACDHDDNAVFEAALVALMRVAQPDADVVRCLSPGALERAVRAAPDLVLADPTRGATLLRALYAFVDPRAYALRARYLEAFGVSNDPRGGLALSDEDRGSGGLSLADPTPPR